MTGGTHPRKNPPKYTKKQLVDAINCIKNSELSYGEAAARFGVPKSTLIKKAKHDAPTLTSRGVKALIPENIENR